MSSPEMCAVVAPRGTIYTFSNIGDSIPMHAHTEDDIHIICVMRGIVGVNGPVIGTRDYPEGTFIDLAIGVEHEVVARTANARTAHFLKKQ